MLWGAGTGQGLYILQKNVQGRSEIGGLLLAAESFFLREISQVFRSFSLSLALSLSLLHSCKLRRPVALLPVHSWPSYAVRIWRAIFKATLGGVGGGVRGLNAHNKDATIRPI